MKIGIAYAAPTRQAWLSIEVPDGTCVKDAIRSGKGDEKLEEIALILERYLGT